MPVSLRRKQHWRTTRNRKNCRAPESCKHRRECRPPAPGSPRAEQQSKQPKPMLPMHKPVLMQRKRRYPTLKRRLKLHRLTRKEQFWKGDARRHCWNWAPRPNKKLSRWWPIRNVTLPSLTAAKQSSRKLAQCLKAAAQNSRKRALRCRCARPNNNKHVRRRRVNRQSWTHRSNNARFWILRNSNFRQTSTPNRRRLRSRKRILITHALSHQRME